MAWDTASASRLTMVTACTRSATEGALNRLSRRGMNTCTGFSASPGTSACSWAGQSSQTCRQGGGVWVLLT